MFFLSCIVNCFKPLVNVLTKTANYQYIIHITPKITDTSDHILLEYYYSDYNFQTGCLGSNAQFKDQKVGIFFSRPTKSFEINTKKYISYFYIHFLDKFILFSPIYILGK